jgi:hypothetical protein
VFEYILDDLLDILVKENAAIGPVGEQPKPRAQHHPVGKILLVSANPLRVGQNSAEEAFLLLVSLELDGAGPAERIVEIDVFLFAQGIDLKFKQLTQSFGPGKTAQHKRIVAERRLKDPHSAGLTEISHCGPLFVQGSWRADDIQPAQRSRVAPRLGSFFKRSSLTAATNDSTQVT